MIIYGLGRAAFEQINLQWIGSTLACYRQLHYTPRSDSLHPSDEPEYLRHDKRLAGGLIEQHGKDSGSPTSRSNLALDPETARWQETGGVDKRATERCSSARQVGHKGCGGISQQVHYELMDQFH